MPRFDQCTKEQLAEYGRRGGRTKAENYKTRRGICETMKILLEMSLSTGKVNTVDEIRAFGKLKGKNVELSAEDGPNGAVTVHAVVDGLMQKFVFTPI